MRSGRRSSSPSWWPGWSRSAFQAARPAGAARARPPSCGSSPPSACSASSRPSCSSATAPPTSPSTPTSRTTCSTGAATPCRRSGSTSSASRCVVTFALWAWTRYTRVGLAINASAQNERAVQTLGWSPDRLAALTWTLGGMLGGLAAVLAAPLTGLSAMTFTIVVTVAGLGAALLGGFHSFPLDARRRPDHRRRRGDGHPLRRRHQRLLPPGPHHRAQPDAGVPRDLPRRRGARAEACRCARTSPSACRGWAPARSASAAVLLASAVVAGAAVRRHGRVVGAGDLHLAGQPAS